MFDINKEYIGTKMSKFELIMLCLCSQNIYPQIFCAMPSSTEQNTNEKEVIWRLSIVPWSQKSEKRWEILECWFDLKRNELLAFMVHNFPFHLMTLDENTVQVYESYQFWIGTWHIFIGEAMEVLCRVSLPLDPGVHQAHQSYHRTA